MQQGQFILVKIGEGNRTNHFLVPPAIVKQLVRLIPLKEMYNLKDRKLKYIVAERTAMLISFEPMTELFEDEAHYNKYVEDQESEQEREAALERIRQEVINSPESRS